MADQKQKVQSQHEAEERNPDSGYGKSGGNMGAGKSGKEDLGAEKPEDNSTMGSHKPDHNGDHQAETRARAHDDKSSARGGGSNQNQGKGGVETDATGGRRAKHNDDNDKYHGRGTGNRG